MNAVKHLTGAGMVGCQGAFCRINALSRLAQHAGLSPEQVTKKGEGSYHVVPSRKGIGA